MPELPEVETVRRSLVPHLPGRTIEEVVVRPSLRSAAGWRVLLHPTPDEFAARLRGQQFERLDRHGKLLCLTVTGSQRLLIHLGMTGQLTFRDFGRADRPFQRHPVTGLQWTVQHPVDAHTHISFRFTDHTEVHYRDIRKFGKFYLYPQGHPRLLEIMGRLGPDPLTPDYCLEGFAHRLQGSQRAIKAVLLDQGVVAGVGNIYADEALHRAGIHPQTPAARLTAPQIQALFQAISEVLGAGIENRGTSLSDYVDGEGRVGTHQDQLRAYGRQGEPCLTCSTPMVRIVVAQRSTTFCPRCQQA